MKLTKLAFVALSATLVFGAKSAVAAPEFAGTTTDNEKLQFNLTLLSQNPDVNKAHTTIWSFNKTKLTNKDILALLANMANTTWPAGAQLEYIYDGSRNEVDDQLVVADRTGTNILFFAGDGVDNSFAYGYFDFDTFDTQGVYAGNTTTQSPVGQESYAEVYFADFEFYADFNYNTDTVVSSSKVAQTSSSYWDLWGGGSTTETGGDKWTPYSDIGFDNLSVALIGGGYYNDNSQNFLTGTVLGVEQWNSVNQANPAAVVKAIGHKSAKKH